MKIETGYTLKTYIGKEVNVRINDNALDTGELRRYKHVPGMYQVNGTVFKVQEVASIVTLEPTQPTWIDGVKLPGTEGGVFIHVQLDI